MVILVLYDLIGDTVICVYVPKYSKSVKVSVLTDALPIRVLQHRDGKRHYTCWLYDLSMATYFVVVRKNSLDEYCFYVVKMPRSKLDSFRRAVKKIYKKSKIIASNAISPR